MTKKEVLIWYDLEKVTIREGYERLMDAAERAKDVLEANRWHENRVNALHKEFCRRLTAAE
jgi:hypothetical protein